MAKAEDLYILRNTLLPGLYKIGRSSDVQKRALALQASQPFRIVIVAVFPGFGFVERAIHGALKYHKVKGGAGIECFKNAPWTWSFTTSRNAFQHTSASSSQRAGGME